MAIHEALESAMRNEDYEGYLKQLNKKKDKLNSQIKNIIEELKQLRKQQTKSLPNIRYVNKNFIPTISFSVDKRSNTYLCVIKLKHSSKSFFLIKLLLVKFFHKPDAFKSDSIKLWNLILLK